MKKPGGSKSSITDENREIIISALFNDPRHIWLSKKYMESEVAGKGV